MSYLYVPASADSTSASDSPAPRHEPSVSWRGKPTQPASWSRACKTAPWIRLLSGLTCPPSTVQGGAESWISSLRGIRANRSRLLGDDRAQTMHKVATSGRMWLASSGNAGLDLFSSRTSPAIYPSGSIKSARNWTAWVTGLRRAYSARLRLAPHTAASGCSRWPTATATDAAFEGSPRNGIKGNHNLSLPNAADRWVTPTALDHKDGADPSDKVATNCLLGRQAPRWSTPHANMTTGAGTQGREGGMNIQTQAGAWPTPRAEMDSDKHRGEADTLHSRTKDWEHGLPALPPTGAESPHVSGPRRLNPAFVCWLMGFPSGWCDFAPIERTNYERWEMQWSPK